MIHSRSGWWICAGMLIAAIACHTAARGADWLNRRDPRLNALTTELESILEDGQLPAFEASADRRAALLDATEGYAADYRAWQLDLARYQQELQAFHAYRDLPTVTVLTTQPIAAAWRMEQWERTVVAGQPGILTALREAERLWREWPATSPEIEPTLLTNAPGNRALPAGLERDLRARSVLPVAGLGGRTARTLALLTRAAEIMDQRVLGAVSPADRREVGEIMAWICRSGGRFAPKSKGSPWYSLERIYAPNDGRKTLPPELQRVTDRLDYAALPAVLRALQETLAPRELDRLQAELQSMAPAASALTNVPGTSGTMLRVIPTPHGRILFGDAGANAYDGTDTLAIFDLGGDDDYRFRLAAADLGSRPLQVIVDFAGDDLYVAGEVGGPAAGLLGVSVLVDRRGNDRYCQGLSPAFEPRRHTRTTLVQPDPEGVNTMLVPFALLWGDLTKPAEPGVPLDAGLAFGAGFLGVGILVDESGDDVYLGQKFAFGCGFWRGVGVVHDVAGNDVYVAGVATIGAGINGAVGLLDDRAGNDHYQCLGMFESPYSAGKDWDNGYQGAGIGYGSSWRAEKRTNPERKPTLGGGIGLVHDAAGDDAYVGSSFGVAAAYAGGVGALVDDAGNDTYFVKRGPGGDNRSGWSGNHALGNGCHRGLGYLLDRAGNDRYSAGHLGGGTAWDLGIGYLIDLGGDDHFTDLHGKHGGGNTGWGAAKAFAVSYQVGGADVYERTGFADASVIGDGYPGVGGNFAFFFDRGAEQDQYPQTDWNDRTRLGGVAWKPAGADRETPQGLGLFRDGPRP